MDKLLELVSIFGKIWIHVNIWNCFHFNILVVNNKIKKFKYAIYNRIKIYQIPRNKSDKKNFEIFKY